LRALQAAESLTPLLEALLAARRRLVEGGEPRKPVFLKVAPDLDEIGEEAVAAVADRLRVDGLIVGNTTVSRPAGLRSRRAGETGGLSGRPLFPLSTRLLARFALRLRGAVPLIAAGGVLDAADAYAKVRAGATAVQVYTGFVYRGPGLVRDILGGLDARLTADGFSDIAAAVGSGAEEMAAG
jgi:dihydroorotate dehydrogenase